MKRLEHLLFIVAEECCEVGQRASKAARFSMGEIQPGHEMNNLDRMIQEFADLYGVIEMVLEMEKTPDMLASARFREMADAKKARVEHFFERSRANGTLDDPPLHFVHRGELSDSFENFPGQRIVLRSEDSLNMSVGGSPDNEAYVKLTYPNAECVINPHEPGHKEGLKYGIHYDGWKGASAWKATESLAWYDAAQNLREKENQSMRTSGSTWPLRHSLGCPYSHEFPSFPTGNVTRPCVLPPNHEQGYHVVIDPQSDKPIQVLPQQKGSVQ